MLSSLQPRWRAPKHRSKIIRRRKLRSMCEQWRDINKKGARRPARFRLYSCVPSKITVLRARSADGSLKGSRVARFDSISRGLALPPIVKIERNNLRTMVSKDFDDIPGGFVRNLS